MTIHPELKHALDANLSVLEVIRLFERHHSGVRVEGTEIFPLARQLSLNHSHPAFWYTCRPLFRKLYHYGESGPAPASEQLLNIHKSLTREIISWLCEPERRSNVYFVAEAQTQIRSIFSENYRANAFASICYNAHRFGLPLRGEAVELPSIYELCSVLAVHYPPFRRILTKILIGNPEIRKLPSRVRFKKLIYEPWKSLQISHPQYVAALPVIVLRWDESALIDEELLRSICEFASPGHGSSLLWIISFSPKCKLPIQDLLDAFECPRLTRLPVCYNDAPADTELFLHHRFSILREKHMEMFTEHEMWPSEEQMSQLITIFSGSFDSIDVVIEFIDWERDGGPKAHLDTFLTYMADSPSPSDERPYCALDNFYTRALSAIPPELFPIMKRVLSVCYFETFSLVTCFQLACLLSCGHVTVLDVLPHLCRWALILDTENEDEIVRYTPSAFFRGFLEDGQRSRHFNIPKSEIRFLAFEVSLRIVGHSSHPSELLKQLGRPALKARGSEIAGFMYYALDTFYNVPDAGSHPEWIFKLRRFDFRCLAYSWSTSDGFRLILFVKSLYAWDKDNSPNIVRVKPAGPLDSQFIEKCEGLAEPLDLEEKGGWWELRPTGPKYVLLGFEAGTVLVMLPTDTNRHPLGEPTYCGFNIYTSAMLEYM